MLDKKPIKRHVALQPLSRDHHQSLLLVWKIRKGIKANIELNRITQYVQWFYHAYELTHFYNEEKYVLPILAEENEAVRKIKAEHSLLKKYFLQQSHTAESLNDLANLLESHVRYEERDFFNVIQQTATAPQLELIAVIDEGLKFKENETDTFWL